MLIPTPIVHQMQTTDYDCMPTCVAMSVGIPVAELGFNLMRPHSPRDFAVWYAERGIYLRPLPLCDGYGEALREGAIYLVEVRSLNDLDTDHALIFDWRGNRSRTYDPNRGRPEKLYYTSFAEDEAISIHELMTRTTDTVGAPPSEEG